MLLEHKADVNARDKHWLCALHICAMYDSLDCARLILKHANNVDLSDRQGRSPLTHAAFNGNKKVSLISSVFFFFFLFLSLNGEFRCFDEDRW